MSIEEVGMDDDEKYKELLPKIINIPEWKGKLTFDSEDIFNGERNFFGWILLDEVVYDTEKHAVEQIKEIEKLNPMNHQWFIGYHFSAHKKMTQTGEFKYFILINFSGTKEFFHDQSVLDILKDFEQYEITHKGGGSSLGCGM